MTLRYWANAGALAFALCAYACLAWGLVLAAPRAFTYAFLLLLAAFACIQLRIRAGGRVPRTPLFWMHLGSAIPFFVILALAAFVVQPLWLLVTLTVLALTTLVSGGWIFLRPQKERA